MKKIITFILFALLSTIGMANDLPKIHVEGNKFVDNDGKTVIFRGLCLSDPVKLIGNNHWDEEYFAKAAEWRANVVRIPVHPENINKYGWDNTFKAIDQGIAWAKKYGMYVIIDWHSIGNLKDAKFFKPMYKTNLSETKKFWKAVAQRYKNEPTVALYELFNEPTITGDVNLGKCSWAEWRNILEGIIDNIRAIDPSAVCLCAGFNWAYDLTPIATEPIRRDNVAYVSHPYPMKREKPWIEQWEKDFGFVADKYPVVCTEIGYSLKNERGAHIPVISDDEYGKTITKYFEKKGISFTAWCFDPHWGPMLISDWNFTPTTQGRFFSKYLKDINKTIYKTEKDIPYRTAATGYAKERCKVDVFYPENMVNCPTVVWFHGGGLEAGEKEIPTELVNNGYVVVGVNYRLLPKCTIDECIDDAAAAVAWAYNNAEKYNGSKDKVFVSGHSAGGYLTMMIGLDKSWLKAYDVDADALAGLIPFSAQMITHYNIRKTHGIGPLEPVIDKYAPFAHMRPDCPPTIIISGDRELELFGRYEEQAYFWRMLKLTGHKDNALYEMQGYDHGSMLHPAFHILKQHIKRIISSK